MHEAYIRASRPFRRAPTDRREAERFLAVRFGRQLCPATSDLDFLGDLNGIVNLDDKIANGALDLRVA
jgi:hypothetical protein